jgi:hypothetical protein
MHAQAVDDSQRHLEKHTAMGKSPRYLTRLLSPYQSGEGVNGTVAQVSI